MKTTGSNDAQARTRDYWLCHCDGFRVESPAGELGTVAEVLSLSSPNRADALAIVLDGRKGPLLVVGVDEVERISPSERRLGLRATPPEPGG